MLRIRDAARRSTLIQAGFATLAAWTATQLAHAETGSKETEVCYGVAKAGQNECANSTCLHLCSGLARTDRDPSEWMTVPRGTCTSQGGTAAVTPKSCSAKPGASSQVGGDLVAGEQLYAHGDAARSIPACASCHGEHGNSTRPEFPRLASQHRVYLSSQLQEFKSQQRPNSVMSTVARNLNEHDIANLSLYLARQKVEEPFARVDIQVKAGASFRDCPHCPEMVPLSPGQLVMGSPDDESGRFGNETQHLVRIRHAFAAGRYDVTFDEWDACVADGGCAGHSPKDEGWGRIGRPVINVSWNDAQAYVTWLSNKTGQRYRLPTEAEWEYMARAGSRTARWWGDNIGRNLAKYGPDDCPQQTHCGGVVSGSGRWLNTAPVGSFPPNPAGLYEVLGNVWQWTQDCWHGDYEGAPDDGSAWMETGAGCQRHVVRGASWTDVPEFVRSATRAAVPATARAAHVGLRVVRDMDGDVSVTARR